MQKVVAGIPRDRILAGLFFADCLLLGYSNSQRSLVHCFNVADLSEEVSSRDQRSNVDFKRHHLASVQDIKNLERKVQTGTGGA